MAPPPPVAPTVPGEGAAQPIPELLQLGEQLVQARTMAGISEEELAQRLRLAPRQLKALEEGDHTRLPEGVFVVALARRIAGALHTDLEDAIQAVKQSRLMRREAPAPHPPAVASTGEGTPGPTHPPALSPPPTARTDPAPMAAAPMDSALKTSVVPWRWPLGALAALIAAGGLAAAWLLFPQPSPKGVSTTPSRPSPLSNPPPAPSLASATASAPAESDSLRLNASEPSWVEVREVNGRTLFEGTLSGEKRFPLGRGIEVIAGRPHAVRVSVGSATGAPLGGVADIRWKRFSPAGLPSDSPSSPSPSP